MDTRLDKTTNPNILRTESADTRLGVRRDENPEQRRKKKEEPHSEDADLWQDHTTVSLESLQIFLHSLINPPAFEAAALQPAAEPPPAPPTAASNAARAYQSTAGQSAPPPAPTTQTETTSTNPDLSPDDVRKIHLLMDDLNFLASHGVIALEIERSDSFLQSLIDAAMAARGTIEGGA